MLRNVPTLKTLEMSYASSHEDFERNILVKIINAVLVLQVQMLKITPFSVGDLCDDRLSEIQEFLLFYKSFENIPNQRLV